MGRLDNAVVRAILESCYLGKAPPVDHPFTIVPVGPNGKDLSPPAYEFNGK